MELAVTTLYDKEGNAKLKKFAIVDPKESRAITEGELSAYITGVIRHSEYTRYRTMFYDFGENVKIAFNMESTDAFKMGVMGDQSAYIATVGTDDACAWVWVSIHMPEILFRVRLEWLTNSNARDVVTQCIYIEGCPTLSVTVSEYGDELTCTAFGDIIAARIIANASTATGAFMGAMDAMKTYKIGMNEYNNICDIAEIMEYAMEDDSDA